MPVALNEPFGTAQPPAESGRGRADPWFSGTRKPMITAPFGATDCHHHVFDARFQMDGQIRVPDATAEQYRLFRQRLGLSRSVIVAPSNYGADNSCLLDALKTLGPKDARGVVYVEPDVGSAELEAMHSLGVRGIRIYLAKNRVPTPAELLSLADRAQALGWSLHFVGTRDREVFLEWEHVLLKLPCPMVVDHFGWAPQPAGIESRTSRLLLRLVERGCAYVKLSAPYLSSAVGSPFYSDLDELAVALIETAPARMIWGSDWPHPMAKDRPDSADLFDRLATWAPDPDTRQMILVDNPSRLYWAS